MGKYNHLQGKKEQIIKALKQYQKFETRAQSIAFLGDLYHRLCVPLPKFLKYYSSESVKEAKTKQHIKNKLRCPNCKKRVIKYFELYAEHTK